MDKKVTKFIKDALMVIFIIVALIAYTVIGYEILTFFNIGAPNS